MGSGSTGPVTPEEIILLILEEMRAEAAPLYYSHLVRSVYQVYLQAEDLERLRPVLPRIREEAIRALNEELAKLNSAKTPGLHLPLLREPKKRKPYEALGEWAIEFNENTDDDAKDNPLIIHSVFAMPKELDDRAGTLTERITRRRYDGQTTTSHRAQSETRRGAGDVRATFDYQDDTGPHLFQMDKEQIKIGRGSPDRWVDLKLHSKKDVSREHAQVRRDTATGRFFIKDLSTLGTTVNGNRIPASIETVEGEAVDKNVEVPLPDKARIGLADVIFLDFKAVRRK